MESVTLRPASAVLFVLSFCCFFTLSQARIALRAAGLTSAASLPSNWTYSGCYSDAQGSRTLAGSFYGDTSGMNASACVNFCQSKNYVYAGTEYSSECYCGNNVASGALQSDSSCNMACAGNASEACGGAGLISIYYANKAAPSGPSTNPGPSGWSSYGCWAEGAQRTLGNEVQVPGGGSNLTVAACTSACASSGYSLAGVEYGGECFCDNYVSTSATNVSITDCSMTCNGNQTEYCGAGSRLNLYAFVNTKPSVKPASSTPPPPGGWFSAGCYNDTVGRRSLSYQQYGLGDGSIEICTAACFKAGYTLAGLEYGGECHCDSTFHNYATLVTDGRCSMPCKGNANETCGGPDGLSVYRYTGWYSAGCWNDTVGTRSLNYPQYGLGDLTVEKCTEACGRGGYPLAGMEYGNECFCDTDAHNYGGPATDGSAGCNMPCKGSPGELCGGPNRLNVWQYNSTGLIASSTSSAAVGATSPATPPVVTPSSSVNATSILPFEYQGCFTDNMAGGRALLNQQPDNQSLTVESCISTCSSLGYTIAGMEYGVQCFCDSFIRYSPTLVSDSDCNMNCGGSTGEKCGAGGRLSIYSNGTMAGYSVPQTQKTDLPGNWTYQGCLTDAAATRSLPYQMINKNNNTNAGCLAQCQTFGYGAGGTEYGQECWCGDVQNVIDAKATIRPDSECNMLCTNDTGKNGGYYCGGGGGRMSYYTWTGPPLSTWDIASGNDAGAYEFLIGGVAIPLITSVSRNGKVIYMEKFGTSPAGNSTGAYELDLNLLHNFTAAWRPMHVKTDLFCSAGLTLPDRAGRQITVGGWANDATYGVRLYWPDGQPGVWGKNDWQENVDKVTLLAGRWYPSVMIMTNGSILVVGGEVGSNGAPQPSIEVLPSPSGELVNADYLARTDPYSTYPFLAVLPSGGIFIGYYNEARILDAGTLKTSRTLPNMPGAVNNFDGGRSYPFEGTAMLMPQHAPYTDPLRIMMCGGSTPGPEIAIDNCVSLTPDVPNAEWAIERMPSKRVLTCMTALPDGTYLILGGGRQGRAGFGLVSDPNLSAVLYDPTKPLHARMTLMANTTVARLYHSEAILLDDGRVLVSGSDPEDERPFAPQEYRNEVFVPPYLLHGAPRPSFNISNIDWAYGESVSFTVTPSSNSSTAGYRVSLMASVASTHGNSMGQRTLFPAVTCSGYRCTVTAPPNANISPPSWFQMFVLDANNIPSNATWVRIGGDPGNLGNWPNVPDFTIPGVGPALPIV